jgi:hypothetical protein
LRGSAATKGHVKGPFIFVGLALLLLLYASTAVGRCCCWLPWSPSPSPQANKFILRNESNGDGELALWGSMKKYTPRGHFIAFYLKQSNFH